MVRFLLELTPKPLLFSPSLDFPSCYLSSWRGFYTKVNMMSLDGRALLYSFLSFLPFLVVFTYFSFLLCLNGNVKIVRGRDSALHAPPSLMLQLDSRIFW